MGEGKSPNGWEVDPRQFGRRDFCDRVGLYGVSADDDEREMGLSNPNDDFNIGGEE